MGAWRRGRGRTGLPFATAVTRCWTSWSWEMRALARTGSIFISSVSLILSLCMSCECVVVIG